MHAILEETGNINAELIEGKGDKGVFSLKDRWLTFGNKIELAKNSKRGSNTLTGAGKKKTTFETRKLKAKAGGIGDRGVLAGKYLSSLL